MKKKVSSGELEQQNIQDGGHDEKIENVGESAGNAQTSKSRKPSFRRPNRDYSKHNTWTYKMNKDLFKIYVEANPKERGYTYRMKKKWDSLHPELNIFTAKHLNTQITSVIKKKLIRETGFGEAAQPTEQNRRSNRRKANSKNEDGGNHNQTSNIGDFNSILLKSPIFFS